ncbi:hypothetical protein [Nocardia altamirensis]|uniref:hypothetical protein n=1 Tax=Nocardia altamirensis TaxID=472158 RepID=UPI0008400691|nr:hypothetical protein [Nocardia altamirensis]
MGRSLVVALLSVFALLTSCAADVPTSEWRELSLPAAGARILALTPVDGGLLAIGSVPGPEGRAPAAWTTADGSDWRTVAVEPHSPYAFQTELISVGIGDRIVVLGQAFGGAHSNPRMTSWSGTPTALVEHPQAMELFGGPHAIAVNAAATLGATDLLVGQWDGASGRYGAAVWTSTDGVHWDRQADDPALAAPPGELTGASGVATGPAGFVVAGNTLRGSALFPLTWTSPDGRTWQRIDLPGQDSVATRVGCDGTGCVLFGQTITAPPQLLCWPTTTSSPTTGPSGATVEVSQVLLRDPQVFTTVRIDGTAHLMTTNRDCTAWHDLALPVAAAQARLGILAGALLVATSDDATASRLWLRRTDAPA